MSSDLARALALFQESLECPAGDREAFLVEACAGDGELLRTVRELHEEDARENDAFDEPQLNARHAALGGWIDSVQGGDPPPETIGPYRVLQRLGQGRAGTVFEAEQDQPRRRVALKVFEVSQVSPEVRTRFRYEAELLGHLQHPGIAQVHASGTWDPGGREQLYLARELAYGRDLLSWAREQPRTRRELLGVFLLLCDAVEHAHRQGVVHRELKPHNILVNASGELKLLDFRVAGVGESDRASTWGSGQADARVQDLAYRSPEDVAEGSSATGPRSDVYSLGLLLFELLAGAPPYDLTGLSRSAAIDRIQRDPGRRLSGLDASLRGDLEAIVVQALEKDPELRYASAAALADDLRRHLDGQRVSARTAGAFGPARRWARRHRTLARGLLLASCTLLLGGGVALWRAVPSVAERQASMRERYRLALDSAASALWAGRASEVLAILADPAIEPLEGWECELLRARASALVDRRDGEQRDARTPPGADLRLAHDSYVYAVRFSPDGLWIVSREMEGTVRVFAAESGRLASRHAAPTGEAIDALRYAPLSFTADGTRLRLHGGKAVYELELGVQGAWRTCRPEQVALRRRGVLYDEGTPVLDAGAHVLLDADGRPGAPLEGAPHPSDTHLALSPSPDGRTVAIARGSASIYDLASGALLHTLGERQSLVFAVAWSPDGSRLATGGTDSVIRLYDTARFELLVELPGHELYVKSLTWSPDGRRLASASGDRTVQVWDAGLDPSR